jgi:hypothetical protein
MVTSSHSLRSFSALLLSVFALQLTACSDPEDSDSTGGATDDDVAAVGKVAQALTDTDSDGMDDTWEVT